jgi:NADP-dependent 3-hydroxy acid dehydrogenase YdfG
MKKTAVITGGNKGIGKAIVTLLHSKGYQVITCGSSVARSNTSEGIISKKVDLSKEKEVLAFVDFIRKECAQVDVLVNNAGVYIPKTFVEESLEDLNLSLDINLKAPYLLTKGLMPHFNSTKAHIFNISSIVAKQAAERAASYTISKFALDAFSKVIKPVLADKNIHVCTIYPGVTFGSSWGDISTELSNKMVQTTEVAQSIWSIIQLEGNVNVDEIIINTNKNPFT